MSYTMPVPEPKACGVDKLWEAVIKLQRQVEKLERQMEKVK